MIAPNNPPPPHKKPHPKKRAFLAAYRKCGNVTAASEMSKVNRHLHYDWLEADAEYRRDFSKAHEEACERLEMEARRRAVEGCDRPVFYQGNECGTIREYSDTLLIFLMKGLMPDRYHDRMEHSGGIDHALTVSPEVIAAAAVARQQMLEERKAITSANGNGASNGNGHTPHDA